ncbi:DUF3788 domain-containing protein [Lacrimispora sp. NSJ-141]|uniref:DUF3788 domain-containing protein n=2 Tax=Lientehia hominis TaxID=2897778 RepID=A0AAP2W9Q2_9FIRM|nr:DUF3788 domain-containing protein [Lientehia hominis]MCD2493630.1 DUF3788 domain-containing protein [Lientehia hominis]
MEWNQIYGPDSRPDMDQITGYIQTPLWKELCVYLEDVYGVSPRIEYSRCSGKPGWNVKYKKSGKALCTLYPEEGFFTCMISIGRKEAPEAELLLTACTSYVKDLYAAANPFNGSRWLMIEVKDVQTLSDVQTLIGTRCKTAKKG